MRRSSSTKYRYMVFALMDSTGLLSTNRLARSQLSLLDMMTSGYEYALVVVIAAGLVLTVGKV
jgi:hypothetical protein